MKNRIALKISLIFFLIYGMVSTFGSIFLVSWGGNSYFKKVLLFFSSYPVNWNELIDLSLWFLLLNIIFWSVVVYLLVFFVMSLVAKARIFRHRQRVE